MYSEIFAYINTHTYMHISKYVTEALSFIRLLTYMNDIY